MRIRTLATHVANQIAAGEVIERPASVVKELLENALDAGAQTIHIDIGFGGLNHIKLSDDGRGIVPEDLPLAVAPHATSKLQSLDDLSSIQSMGFRGEALASIASIARVSIQSCAAHQTEAMGLVSDEDGMHLVPCARSQGTTIDVRDLFFNAPVRKKFLKTERQEYQAIEALVKRLAFCEPRLAFTLTHNGSVRLNLPAAPSEAAERARLTKLLGKAFVDHALRLDVTRGEMRLYGWTSGVDYGRSQQDKLWFYINKRLVRDKLVLHAVKQAYASVLPPGRYPGCVLFLSLPLGDVDVNVHPTKHEVRFCDARAVHDFIRSSLTELLMSAPVAEAKPDVPADVPLAESQAWQKPVLTASSEAQTAYAADGAPCVLNSASGAWQVLNAEFALVYDQNMPYLLHVTALHRERLTAKLKHAERPWPARPLLVPVVVMLMPEQLSLIQRHQDDLKTCGLVFEVLDAQNIRIKTIPCALPYLDLTAFFTALSIKEQHTPETLSHGLIQAEQLHIHSMSPDEQAEIIAYWKTQTSKHFCLDTNGCRKVLSYA